MVKTRLYSVHPGWRILLHDAGIHPGSVLRRAELSDDRFAREQAYLEPEAYYRLFCSLEEEANDPTIPLRLGTAISVESFDPPIFAALFSKDLNTALERLARYKPLIGPMVLHVEADRTGTTVTIEWPAPPSPNPPAVLVQSELAFFVQLARIATREHICPLEVRSPYTLEPALAFARFFGVPVHKDTTATIRFHAEDAARPFLTANEKM